MDYFRKHGVEDESGLVGNHSGRSTTWPLDAVTLPGVVPLPLDIFLDCAQGMVPHDVVYELGKQ
jgi:hypothetical protein